MKPLIGITANYIKDDEIGRVGHMGGEGQNWHALADDYIESVHQAGGVPVMIPVLPDPACAEAYLDVLDGMLFSGGCDISPINFGQDITKEVGQICPERDAQELALIHAALKKPGFPVFGICRGCQLLNVALGGDLVIDIDASVSGDHFMRNQRMNVPTHKVEAEADTLIDHLLNGEKWVNSYHHQCIQQPGCGVVITAYDNHGVPECIEVPERKGFTLGTQWHPEGMACYYDGHFNIFKAFVHAAADYKSGR